MESKRMKMAYESYFKMYRKAISKKEKSKILGDFCDTTNYNRKYAIKILKRVFEDEEKEKEKRKRSCKYDDKVKTALKYVWEYAGYPWSKRLKGMMREWIGHLKGYTKWQWLDEETERKLLEISERQMDRILEGKRKNIKRSIYTRTKPGSLLKHQIPVRTRNRDIKEPGYLEIDLVSHSGEKASGEWIYSLNATDIYSGWVETEAVMGSSQEAILNGLKRIIARFPFKVKAIDSDNGGEFINFHLYNYCKDNGIKQTRSRSYKKNDNCHIEQKNWTHVRKIFGWGRFDTEKERDGMNEIYRGDLRMMLNLFQASVKLIEITHIGSKVKRVYDSAKTPLERLKSYYQERGQTSSKIQRLYLIHCQINPFELSSNIEKKLESFFNLHRNKQGNRRKLVMVGSPARQPLRIQT
jgi:hypothetical protein